MTTVEQGAVITLHLVVKSNGTGTDLDAPPDVRIVQPNASTIETGVGTDVGEGVYSYNFAVASDAPTGDWYIEWSGAIGGTPVSSTEFFTVTMSSVESPSTGVLALETAGTPWADAAACTVPGASDEQIAYALQASSDVLWARSGRRFGLSPVTVRPCTTPCYNSYGGILSRMYGYTGGYLDRVDGQWLNVCGPGCSSGCSCSTLSSITLRPAPVAQIVSVTLNGVVLVENVDYRLVGNRKLYRLGAHTWPTCQDMAAGDNEDGAFTVVYLVGEDVPSLGALAAAELSCEILKAMVGDTKCKLPRRAREIVRQGVDIQVLNPEDFAPGGVGLGLYLCDMFLDSVNPSGLTGPPLVHHIDAPISRA